MNEVATPRISRRRAVLIVVAGLAVAGALIGAMWAWIVPPINGVVALTRSGERVRAYLGNEADHFFIGAFLIVGMLSALAVVAAVPSRRPLRPARVRCWCIGATARSMWPLRRFLPSIGCTTSPRRPPCSSGIHRCRSR